MEIRQPRAPEKEEGGEAKLKVSLCLWVWCFVTKKCVVRWVCVCTKYGWHMVCVVEHIFVVWYDGWCMYLACAILYSLVQLYSLFLRHESAQTNMELTFFSNFTLMYPLFEEAQVIKRRVITEVAKMSKENHFKLLYSRAWVSKMTLDIYISRCRQIYKDKQKNLNF